WSISEKQQSANRATAAKSTGPPEVKAHSSQMPALPRRRFQCVRTSRCEAREDLFVPCFHAPPQLIEEVHDEGYVCDRLLFCRPVRIKNLRKTLAVRRQIVRWERRRCREDTLPRPGLRLACHKGVALHRIPGDRNTPVRATEKKLPRVARPDGEFTTTD